MFFSQLHIAASNAAADSLWISHVYIPFSERPIRPSNAFPLAQGLIDGARKILAKANSDAKTLSEVPLWAELRVSTLYGGLSNGKSPEFSFLTNGMTMDSSPRSQRVWVARCDMIVGIRWEIERTILWGIWCGFSNILLGYNGHTVGITWNL